MKIQGKFAKLVIKEPCSDTELVMEGVEYEYEGNTQETTAMISEIGTCISSIAKTIVTVVDVPLEERVRELVRIALSRYVEGGKDNVV